MNFPRRIDMQRFTPAEKAIFDATDEVERAGAHPLLTDAVILLGQARAKVADYVDSQIEKKNMKETIELLQKLLEILGNVDLETAKSWVAVEENARQLLAEGHEETE